MLLQGKTLSHLIFICQLGFPKEGVEVSIKRSSQIDTELEGGVVFVVFNHIDSLPRYPDDFGQL